MPGTPELRDKDQQINDVEQPSRNMSRDKELTARTDDKSTPTYISMQTIDKIGDSSFESRDYTTESKKTASGSGSEFDLQFK